MEIKGNICNKKWSSVLQNSGLEAQGLIFFVVVTVTEEASFCTLLIVADERKKYW